MEKIFEIYIRTTPERLWEAITDGEIRGKYQFGNRVKSDWTPGSRFEMSHPKSPGLLGEGVNLEVEPPRRLVQSMIALWGDDVKREGTSRVTWEIEPVGDSCRLTVTHDQLREGANDQLYGGWPMILSGLKTWLETGELLTPPGSLVYSRAGGWGWAGPLSLLIAGKQPAPAGDRHRFGGAIGAQLGQDVGHVHTDRLGADEQ